MQNPLTIQPNLFLVCVTLLAAGCASSPPPAPAPAPAPVLSGEEMLRESQGLASLGDMWKKGKRLVDSGNAMVREGQNKIDEGQRLINEGQKIMQESEQNYKNIKN